MAEGAGMRGGPPAEQRLSTGGIPFRRLHKLGVDSRLQDLVFAVRHGLVKVGVEATRARPAARRADRLKKTKSPRASTCPGWAHHDTARAVTHPENELIQQERWSVTMGDFCGDAPLSANGGRGDGLPTRIGRESVALRWTTVRDRGWPTGWRTPLRPAPGY